MHPILIVELLVLIAVANAAPVIVKKLFGTRFAWPLDGGILWADGRPLLGPAKTIRGLVAALVATPAVSVLLGLSWETGALIAAAAMAGDLLSSFVKRRLRLASSSMALGLDQIPESLFPFIAASWLLPVTLLDITLGTVIAFVGLLAVSRVLFRLGVRDEPY